MPWKETCPMDQRLQFIGLYLSHEYSMAALCRQFSISRKTGYKLVQRYIQEGVSGLADRSRAPEHHPNRVRLMVEQSVLDVRQRFPHWGPRKLRAWLLCREPELNPPAASTIGEILSRHGLTVPRKRSRRTQPYSEPFRQCDRPNAVWSADFKGWFFTGDRTRCEPLTITDNYSRYLLRCQALTPTGFYVVQPIFEAAFREYGLPDAIRTDNGVPFATTTVAGLSRLSIWWIKLGIIPERIEPGKPAQNGRHERMHRTLKAQTASPPQATLRAQQRAFMSFCREYNLERPHEGINLQTPAKLYHGSAREYPLLLPDIEYPGEMVIRRVHSQGDLRWKNQQIYLSQTLAGELIGLRQVSERLWDIYFAHIKLAQLDSYTLKLVHLSKRRKPMNKETSKLHKKLLPMCPV